MEASGGEAGGEMWWSVGGADVSVVSVGGPEARLGSEGDWGSGRW